MVNQHRNTLRRAELHARWKVAKQVARSSLIHTRRALHVDVGLSAASMIAENAWPLILTIHPSVTVMSGRKKLESK